ncbi:MAG: type II toxin-antitoxin system VapC family toxin [Candidatus Limnocylindria bacterium]
MIFVDTSFWIALRNAKDADHAEARQLYLARAKAGLVTTQHVRGETWTWLRRKIGHRPALHFLDSTARSSWVTIVGVGEELEREAWRWLRRHDERSYSFVDATSFAVMRSLRIREALTFDRDFGAAGFVPLRA